MDQNNKPKKKFGAKSLIIGGVLILLIVASAVYWYVGQLGYVETDDAYVDADKINVSAKVMGRIQKLYVDEGDTVYTGELLAELDTIDLIARKNQILTNLEVGNAGVKIAKLQLKQAQQDFERIKKQFDQGVVPQVEYDHSLDKVETLTAQLRLAEKKIENIKSQIDIVNTQLADTKIFSPHDGVVVKKWNLTGEVIQPGQSIFSLFDLKNIWVTAQLEETNINKVNLGDEVDMDVDAFPDQKFKGKVIQLGSNTAAQFALIPPSNASGNFTKVTQRIPIKIELEEYSYSKRKAESQLALLPGMSVVIKIKVD